MYFCGALRLAFVGRDLRQELSKIGSGELPLKRFGDSFPIVLAVEQAFGELAQVGEFIRIREFSPDDKEVDFDLTELTGVDGAMDEGQAWKPLFESGC